MGLPFILPRQYPKGLGDIVDEVKEAVGDYTPFDKLSFSACGETEIMEHLRSLNKKTVIVCGVEAHVCVGGRLEPKKGGRGRI